MKAEESIKEDFTPCSFCSCRIPLIFRFSIISTMRNCLLTLDGSGKVFFAGKSSEREWRWVVAWWRLIARDCDENRSIIKGRLDPISFTASGWRMGDFLLRRSVVTIENVAESRRSV